MLPLHQYTALYRITLYYIISFFIVLYYITISHYIRLDLNYIVLYNFIAIIIYHIPYKECSLVSF